MHTNYNIEKQPIQLAKLSLSKNEPIWSSDMMTCPQGFSVYSYLWCDSYYQCHNSESLEWCQKQRMFICDIQVIVFLTFLPPLKKIANK